MRFLTLLLFSTLLISCSSSTPDDVDTIGDQLISEDKYQPSIETVENADAQKVDDDLSKLREKTYLSYGLYLEYRGPEDSSMRDRMTSALEQFIKVLNIKPDNQKARS